MTLRGVDGPGRAHSRPPPLTRKVRGCAGIVSDGARQAGCPGSDTSAELIRRTFGRSVDGGIMILSLMSVRRSVIRSWRRLRRPTLGRLLWASVALHVVVGLGILAWLARESPQAPPPPAAPLIVELPPAEPGPPLVRPETPPARSATRPTPPAARPAPAPRPPAPPPSVAKLPEPPPPTPAPPAPRDSTSSGPGPSHAAGGGPGARAALSPCHRRLRRPHRLRPPRLLRPRPSRRRRRSGRALPLPKPRVAVPAPPGPSEPFEFPTARPAILAPRASP